MTTEYFDNSSSILSSTENATEYASPQENPPEAVIKESLITEKCDTLPQGGDGKKYRMFVVTLCGIAMRMIVTDEEKVKNPETAGRALWFCLKDLGDGLGSTDHMNQLKLIKEPDEKNPIYSRIFTNSEIIFDNSGTVGFTVLNNRGQSFICLTGVFMVLAKNELNSKTAEDFREELYERVLPSLAFTGKAEISPEYAEKIGMDAPAPAVPDFTKLTRREILQMALDAEIAKEEAEKKLALSCQELDDEKEDHRHDNCVKNGRAGGLTKNRNFHQARADAAEARAYEAEAKTEEQAKTIDELKERLMNELEDWKTARDFCEPTRFSFYDYTLKYRISEDLVRVSAILHITWKRGEYSRQFRKQAFDVLLHHFCCDPTYLKEWRYDWHENMYKYGALSRECGDKLEGTPDILEGLV